MSRSNTIPAPGSHAISLQKAIEMTTLYRKESVTILDPTHQTSGLLPLSETFNRDMFDQLLSMPETAAIRIYYGMSDDLQIHAIFVAVNANNEDILPAQQRSATATAGADDPTGDDIYQSGQRCPTICPPASPLNS
jgi:hypothetical protein